MLTVNIDPNRYRGVLLDMDGVLTDTATVHLMAWQRLFEEYLPQRRQTGTGSRRPLSPQDYRQHIDGKPRADGVADFLKARGITIPVGHPDDMAGLDTAHGLGARKDQFFVQALNDHGVAAFTGAHALLTSLRRNHLGTAVVSASRHCSDVLERAYLADLFDARVDGAVAQQLDLAGKPDPATLLEAARRLALPPARTVVIDDALAGVVAGRAGEFGLVVGIGASQARQRLLRAGAHVVVSGVDAITVGPSGPRHSSAPGT